MSLADSISVVSAYLKRYLLALAPPLEGRILVNPNGVDSARFQPPDEATKRRSRQALGIPAEAIVLGYVGGMERFRRLPQVVAEMARLRTGGLDRLFLVLIGNGQDYAEVVRVARRCSSTSEHWIHYADVWEPHDRIPFRLAAFDVGMFPFSNPYGSPLKVLEYMACGLPVIGPEVPAVTEATNREYLPFLVKPDGSNLAELVQHVYHHLDTCRREAIKARTLVEREFTWEQNASRIIASLTSLPPHDRGVTVCGFSG
jgi:glycosyltransferase involved in cell wall biosynthesis